MVSSLSPHSLHLLFCFVLCILALIWLVLMALFCAAIRRDSVSLLKFPFLSHVQVLLCEMLFISRLNRPWGCFPSHFCFLVFVIVLFIVLSVLFLMAVISHLSCFLCSHRVVVWKCLRCWQVLFLSLFLVHIVCQTNYIAYILNQNNISDYKALRMFYIFSFQFVNWKWFSDEACWHHKPTFP